MNNHLHIVLYVSSYASRWVFGANRPIFACLININETLSWLADWFLSDGGPGLSQALLCCLPKVARRYMLMVSNVDIATCLCRTKTPKRTRQEKTNNLRKFVCSKMCLNGNLRFSFTLTCKQMSEKSNRLALILCAVVINVCMYQSTNLAFCFITNDRRKRNSCNDSRRYTEFDAVTRFVIGSNRSDDGSKSKTL